MFGGVGEQRLFHFGGDSSARFAGRISSVREGIEENMDQLGSTRLLNAVTGGKIRKKELIFEESAV